MITEPGDQELARETELILNFLGGRFVGKQDDKQEREARKLLAQRLRYSMWLSEFIRWRLAAMIDPDDTDELWRLELKPRRKRLPSLGRDQEIAHRIAVWKVLHDKQMKWILDPDPDVGPIAAEFGVSRKTAQNAWRKYGDKMIRELTGPLNKSDYRRWLSEPHDARRTRANKTQKDSD
jgi:hypothetical protein